MEQNCDVVEPRSIPLIIHHLQRFFTHTYCGLFVLYNFIVMIVPTLPELQMMQFKFATITCGKILIPCIFFENFEPGICYENGLTRVQAHSRKITGNWLQTFILRTKWRVFFKVQENKRFKIVNLFGFCVCEGDKQLLYH